MHIKRVLSCALAGLMTITSFNFNVMAAELPDPTGDEEIGVTTEEQVDEDIPAVNDAQDTDDASDEESDVPEETPASEEGGAVDVPETPAEPAVDEAAEAEEEEVVEDEADDLLGAALTSDMITVDDSELVYTGADLVTGIPSKVTVKTTAEGDAVTADGNYTLSYKNSANQEVTAITAAGTYKVVVTAAAEPTSAVISGSAEKEFTVAKCDLSKKIALEADKTEGEDPAGDSAENHAKAAGKTDTTLDKYNAYYYTKDIEDEVGTTNVNEARTKGVDMYPVNPVVAISGITGLTEDTENATPANGKYVVAYSNNTAVGTAKVTITLADNIKANFTAASYDVEFSIVDGTETAGLDAGTWGWAPEDGDKATLSNSGSTAGTYTGYGPTYGKKTTKEIPAVDLTTIKVKGSKLEKDFDAVGIEKILDTNGLDISTQFTISKEAGDDGATITITAKSDADYTGSYELTYDWATKDCSEGHTYSKHIQPANFLNDGFYWYECDDCGTVAANGATITVDGKSVTVPAAVDESIQTEGRVKIPKLDATKAVFYVTNGKTIYRYTANASTGTIEPVTNDAATTAEITVGPAVTEIPFLGTPITVVQSKVYNAIVEDTTDSTTIKIKAVEDYDVEKPVTNFTITPSNNTGVGTAKFTIKFAQTQENYANATSQATTTKEIAISKNVEKPAAPTLNGKESSDISVVEYGSKLELATSEGAKVYYEISTTAGASTATDGIDDLSNSTEKTAFETWLKDEAKEYADPITVAVANVYSDDITITAVAVKTVEGTTVYSAPVQFTVTPEYSWGNTSDGTAVSSSGSDGPTSAANIPSGLWISTDTLDSLLDAKTNINNAGASFDNGGTNTASAWVTYSGFAKTLPQYTYKSYKSTDSYRVFYGNKLLKYGTDYSIAYSNNVNAGKAEIIVTGKGKYAETFVQEFTIKPRSLGTISGTAGVVSSIYESVSVSPRTTVTKSDGITTDGLAIVVPDNGQIQNPKLTLTYTQRQYTNYWNSDAYKDVTKTLKEGTDFVVDYSDVQAGVTGDNDHSYPIHITLIGNYTTTDYSGSDPTIAGKINDRNLYVVSAGRNIAKATVTIEAKDIVLDGSDKAADVKPTVTLEGVTLVAGTDYDVSYSYNGNFKATAWAWNEVRSAGKYTATITGKGDYAGQTTKAFEVPASAARSLSTKGITAEAKKSSYDFATANAFSIYTGAAQVDVVDNGDTLVAGTDYVVAMPAKLKVGKNTATVYGIGAYTGTKSVIFNVTGQTPDVSIDETVFVYDGGVQAPTLTAKADDVNGAELAKESDTDTAAYDGDTGTITLNGEVFDVTWPKDTTNVGTKKVVIKGRNGNKFKKELTYTIKTASIADITDISVLDESDSNPATRWNPIFVATGDANYGTLNEIAYTNAAPVVKFTLNGHTYRSDESFGKANASFTFKKGFKAGATVELTVKGKKNFDSKSQIVGTFKIANADIAANTTATVSDVVAGSKFKAPTVKVVSNLTGKTLSAETRKSYKSTSKDYKVEYLYNANSTSHSRYDKVVESEAMVAGTEYIARITGLENGFEGHKDVVFRVVAKNLDIAKATVTVNRKFLFDGKETKIDKDDITVVLNKVVVPSAGFEIVGYTYPMKNGQLTAGTGKVRLHGISDGTTTYGGYKDVNFTIEAAPVDYAIQFKADRTSTTNELLTIGKTQGTMKNKKNGIFTLPKSGFTASRTVYNATTKKYEKTDYVLSYYYLESTPAKQYKGGDKIDLANTDNAFPEFATVQKGQAVTLVAKFEKATTDPYTITFKPGKNGTATATGTDKTVKVKRGQVYKLPKQNFKLDGYVLAGYATSEGGAKVYDIGDSVSNLAAAKADVKLYGYYEKVVPSYTITYKLDGGKITSKKGDYDEKYNENTNGTLPAVAKAGYHLTKWQVDGKDATLVDKSLKKNVVATPVWAENTYTLSYYLNSTTATSTVPTGGSKKYTDKFDMPAAPTNSNAEVSFLGWAKEKGAVKADYKAGQKNVQILTENAAAVKLFGVWKHQTYGVKWTFTAADKKSGAKFTKAGDSKFTKAGISSLVVPTVTLKGADFKGWTIDGKTYDPEVAASRTALEKAIVTAANAKKAVELTASFEANNSKVSVTYSTTGSTDTNYKIAKVELSKDGTTKAATWDDTKSPVNQTFSHWAATGTVTGKSTYKAGETIKFADASGSSISLSPQFVATTASITYTLNGGTSASVLPKTWTSAGETVPALTAPTGYTFKGWRLTGDETATPTSSFSITLADHGKDGKVAPVALTAVMEAVSNTVTLNLNGGSLKTENINSATITNQWTVSGNATKSVKYTDSVTLPTPADRTGWTFDGWKQTAPTTSTTVSKDVTITNLTVAPTYTAQWTPNQYTVTLTLNGTALASEDVYSSSNTSGWKLSADKSTATKTWTFGTAGAITVPTLTKDNYTVAIKDAGAATDTNATDIDTETTAKNISWNAVATENKKLTIKFEAGTTGASGSMDDVIIYAGKSANLPACTMTVAGKQFNRWARKANETYGSANYDAKAEISVASNLSADTTLTLIPEFETAVNTVKFVTRFEHLSVTVSDITVNADATSVTEVNNPSTTGYTFAGWNTKLNGSGTTVVLKYTGTDDEKAAQKAATLAILKPETATKATTTVLYAQWTPWTRTVKFDATDGTGSISDMTYTYGKTFTLPTSADGAKAPSGLTAPSGYHFDGWVTESGGDTAVVVNTHIKPTTASDSAVTIYAKWTADTP